MKSFINIVLGIVLALSFFQVETNAESAWFQPKFYTFKVKSLDGKPVNLATYKNKVILVVNTASKCGFTPQYKGLQALYDKYEKKGFVVLGFPSNDFMSQEPGSNQEIKKFCEINYGVKFPLFEKAPVKGDQKQPLYKYLTEQGPEAYRGEISWNFNKFLISRKGEIIGRFGSTTKPEASDLTQAIEKAL